MKALSEGSGQGLDQDDWTAVRGEMGWAPLSPFCRGCRHLPWAVASPPTLPLPHHFTSPTFALRNILAKMKNQFISPTLLLHCLSCKASPVSEGWRRSHFLCSQLLHEARWETGSKMGDRLNPATSSKLKFGHIQYLLTENFHNTPSNRIRYVFELLFLL